MNELEDLWTNCLELLRKQVTDGGFRTCLSCSTLVTVGERDAIVGVPNRLVRERVADRYLDVVRETLSANLGRDVSVELVITAPDTVIEEGDEDPAPAAIAAGGRSALPPNSWGELPSPPDLPTRSGPAGTELDSRYTFDTFVIASSNRFSHAAAQSVSESPGRTYNPLFIYGEAGLGKTHLLQAIGNYVQENFTGRKIRYVTCETYMNEFVEAIRTNAMIAFKRRYRGVDVLLIDDVQFIERSEQLQEEFFHNFNSLYGASKQIVITSDRAPKSIAKLEDRLRSRFMSGLVTEIQPPDLETRLAILQTKALCEDVAVPDSVLEFIATHVTENIRELEGALIRVTAFASLYGQPLSRELAEEVLRDIVATNQPRPITADVILQEISRDFGFPIADICGHNRRRPLVTARQVGMYVFRQLTDFSYPAIGREFGDRDHSTVIHAVTKIEKLMAERAQIYNQVTDLIIRIRTGSDRTSS